MKKSNNSLLVLLMALFTFAGYGQSLPPGGGNDDDENQATIFELESLESIADVAADMVQLMEDSAVVHPPSLQDLITFLGKPFLEGFEEFDLNISSDNCIEPGLRVYNNDGKISFRYDNLTDQVDDAKYQEMGLFVGVLDYDFHGTQKVTYAILDDRFIPGSDEEIECFVILIGTICNSCDAGVGNLCVSRLQILIVDKDII